MTRPLFIALVATLAFIGPADCSESPASTSRNGGKAHVAAFRPPGEVIVDDNGNLTDDGTRLLHYDYKNRLVAVSDKASMRPVAAYEYLPDGRRAKKVVFAPDGLVAKATAFFYDGAQEVEEQDAGSGVTEATYVWSPVYVDELVTYTNSAGTFYTHQDARCDVVAITDSAGTVVERVRFDDFGRAEIRGPGGEARAVSAVGCAYGFQGRRLDAETGLLYFRARYYDPETGRFVQRDPVWDAGNVGGQYTFVGNNPASLRDPTGRDPWSMTDRDWAIQNGRRNEERWAQERWEREYAERLDERNGGNPSTLQKIQNWWAKWGIGGDAYRAGGAVDDFVFGGMLKTAERENCERKSNAAYGVAIASGVLSLTDTLSGGGKKQAGEELVERVLARQAADAAGDSMGQRLWRWIAGQMDARFKTQPDRVYRAPQPGPYTGPANPNAARTPGEHYLGRDQGVDRLTGSPFESWTSDRRVAEEFAELRGTQVQELDLNTVRDRVAADLRTPEGRAAAAAAETNAEARRQIGGGAVNDSEVILRRAGQ